MYKDKFFAESRVITNIDTWGHCYIERAETIDSEISPVLELGNQK
jgi:hypothetical protein